MAIASRGRTPILAALIIIAALALAACGSSAATGSHSSTAAASAAAASAAASGGGTFNRAKFRACLKSHGVTLPARAPGAGPSGPPPGAQSGSQSSSKQRRGFFGGGGAFANPKLRAAIQACGGARFRGAGARRFALSHTAVLKFVACVNKHGYKLPIPNFSGKGSIFPAGIRRNAKFEKAARSCASLLRPPGPPPGAITPPTGSSSPTSGA